MEFVNSIAKIVHMEVSLHGGSPNKNIGDAFLLVWKLPKGFTSRDIPKISDLPLQRSETGSLSFSAGKHMREGKDRGFGLAREDSTGSKDGSTNINIHAFGGNTGPSSFSKGPSSSQAGITGNITRSIWVRSADQNSKNTSWS